MSEDLSLSPFRDLRHVQELLHILELQIASKGWHAPEATLTLGRDKLLLYLAVGDESARAFYPLESVPTWPCGHAWLSGATLSDVLTRAHQIISDMAENPSLAIAPWFDVADKGGSAVSPALVGGAPAEEER